MWKQMQWSSNMLFVLILLLCDSGLFHPVQGTIANGHANASQLEEQLREVQLDIRELGMH